MERIVIDCSTGEQTVVPLTTEEITEREAMKAQAEADRLATEAEAEAKAVEKAAVLARLGITEDEAKLLLG